MYILCLWNSQERYENTVHNLGAMFGNNLKKQLNSIFKSKVINYEYIIKNTEYSLETYTISRNHKLRILFFQGYINYTGTYIKEYIEELPNFSNEELLVIYDDITLKTGSSLITYAKGSGYHNGARGIDESLSREYWRFRVGYEKPNQITANDFVLSKINDNFKNTVLKMTYIFLDSYIKNTKKTNDEKMLMPRIQSCINNSLSRN